jgi:hypothetical protein
MSVELYVARYLLWMFPARLVRVWYATQKCPVECVHLALEARAHGIRPRRRLYRGPAWRPKLRSVRPHILAVEAPGAG